MPSVVSGEEEEFGEVISGDGEPVLRLRAPLGSTLRGSWGSSLTCVGDLISLKAGLMVISGLTDWPSLEGDLGPGLTVRLKLRDSLSSLSFSCHSRA